MIRQLRHIEGLACLLIGLSAASPALAQTLGQGSEVDIPWIRLTAALLLCLGLAGGAIWALNRRLKGSGAGLPGAEWLKRLRVKASDTAASPRLSDIETIRPSPHVTVSVFKCDGRSFMVATTLQGQITLVSLDDQGEAS